MKFFKSHMRASFLFWYISQFLIHRRPESCALCVPLLDSTPQFSIRGNQVGDRCARLIVKHQGAVCAWCCFDPCLRYGRARRHGRRSERRWRRWRRRGLRLHGGRGASDLSTAAFDYTRRRCVFFHRLQWFLLSCSDVLGGVFFLLMRS